MEIPDSHQFTYVIGNNGSGKSRALERSAQVNCKARPVVVISSGFADKFTYRGSTKKTDKGSYTYLGNRTVGNATHINTLSANVILYYARLLKDAVAKRLFDEFLSGIGFSEEVTIAQRKTKRATKKELFPTSVIDTNFVDKYSQILEDRHKPFEAMFSKSGRMFKFSELSSGEQSVIATALKIASHVESNACFYIDEPEISLHVEWQIKWPEVLRKFLIDTPSAKAFVATHSPVIISSALKTGASCFSLTDDTYDVIEEKDLNVERLIFKDFNTLTSGNRHIYSEFATILGKAVDGLNDGQRGVQDKTRADVAALKARVRNLSKAQAESAEINQAMADFEKAIEELLVPSADVDSNGNNEIGSENAR